MHFYVVSISKTNRDAATVIMKREKEVIYTTLSIIW